MKKSDIKLRHENGATVPVINVKYYGTFHREELAKHFGVDADGADMDRALNFAWESACEQFWEQAQDAFNFAWHGDSEASAMQPVGRKAPRYKVYRAGRVGGWLYVDGLPDVETWNGTLVAKWGKFERLIESDIKYRTSFESLRDGIEANEWLKPGSERYNFVDRPGGTVSCIADLKAGAIAAGFGPVVRK